MLIQIRPSISCDGSFPDLTYLSRVRIDTPSCLLASFRPTIRDFSCIAVFKLSSQLSIDMSGQNIRF